MYFYVSDANNLDKLAAAFGRPLYEVRHYYSILLHMLAKEGGIDGLRNVVDLYSKLKASARFFQLTLHIFFVTSCVWHVLALYILAIYQTIFSPKK